MKEARKLYYQYETGLSYINSKLKIHQPPYWWENSTDAVFLPIYQEQNPIGFIIVGYGKFVDFDVNSEICEIYLHPEHRKSNAFKKLLKIVEPYLKAPWGFQVVESNYKAIFLFEHLLNKNYSYQKKLVLEKEIKVYKYRVFSKYK